MKKPTKDLFDDTTMTFGEHLEALRSHLIKALIGLTLTVGICLYKGDVIVDFVRRPIDKALRSYSEAKVEDDTEEMTSAWESFKKSFNLDMLKEIVGLGPAKPGSAHQQDKPGVYSPALTVTVNVDDLAQAIHQADPERFPAPPGQALPAPASAPADAQQAQPGPPKEIALTLRAPEFAQLQANIDQARRPITLNVQEAFMTYIKVSLIAGVVVASPWIFYQLWQFVAAGLYPHERKYVYLYGTMSLGLFLAGAAFCFYLVFPFVLHFLLGFNAALELQPQIRLSEWISFAVFLPLMFGISFQLPLAMLFLQRISIFQLEHYQTQRRMAILVIAILSSILTPADPMSMILMLVPLVILYELGILLCKHLPPVSNPFDEPATSAG